MTITSDVVFSNATRRDIRDYDGFDEAVVAVYMLAEAHGADRGDGNRPPDRIQVKIDGKIELSVRIVRGGLLRSRDGR